MRASGFAAGEAISVAKCGTSTTGGAGLKIYTVGSAVGADDVVHATHCTSNTLKSTPTTPSLACGETRRYTRQRWQMLVCDQSTTNPTTSPTASPSSAPTVAPSAAPSTAPSSAPTVETVAPTEYNEGELIILFSALGAAAVGGLCLVILITGGVCVCCWAFNWRKRGMPWFLACCERKNYSSETDVKSSKAKAKALLAKRQQMQQEAGLAASGGASAAVAQMKSKTKKKAAPKKKKGGIAMSANPMVEMVPKKAATGGKAEVLPDGWVAHETTDGTNKVYYYHTTSHRTSWTVPTDATVGSENAALAAAAEATDALPTGWSAHVTTDGSGKTYYHHGEKGETSWIHPKHVDGLPEGWEAVAGDGDKVYFHNKASGETSWTKPGGAAI